MGGNVFGTSVPIEKKNIEPTLKRFKSELNDIFPGIAFNWELLGSAGKKAVSGDIDLALDISELFKDGKPLLNEWIIRPGDYNYHFERFKAKAKTSLDEQLKLKAFLHCIHGSIAAFDVYHPWMEVNSKSAGDGSLFFEFPQFDENGKLDSYVQIDLNIGNIEWLKFSYHSDQMSGNIKGLHRTQLLSAMCKNKQLIFRHGSGLVDANTFQYIANTPQQFLWELSSRYGFKLSYHDTKNYFTLMECIKQGMFSSSFNSVIDTYLRILDSTRCDIPEDLQEYWYNNRERLGLTGKFIPETSYLQNYEW